MKLTHTNKNYFYFSLDDDDFQKDFVSCRRFLNVFKKEFSAGKHGDRFWLKEFKCWAIKKSCLPRFRELLEKYFDVSKQEDFFNDKRRLV